MSEDLGGDVGAWLPGLPQSTEQYLRDAGVVPPGGEGDSRADDLQAALHNYSNDLLLFGRVPRLFGRKRVFPPLAALPTRLQRSGKDVVVVAYTFGPGPLKFDDLQLGGVPLNKGKRETAGPIRTISDTDLPLAGIRYQVREGAAGDTDVDLFPDFASTVSAGAYAEVKKSDGWVSLPLSPTGAKLITVGIGFPDGLAKVAANGTLSNRSVDFRVRHRAVKADGSYVADDWYPSGEGTRFTATAKQKTAFETSTTFSNSFLGSHPGKRIQVQVKREDPDDPPGTTNLSRSILKSLTATSSQQPVKKAGFALVVLEIPTTLLGTSEIPRFTAVTTTVFPVWNGSDWSATAETRNPASFIRHILTSAENKRAVSLSRVDQAALGAFWTDCKGASSDGNLNPDRACDVLFTGTMTVRAMLRLVAACGRGSMTRVDGRFGARTDKAWSGDPAAYFTPGNSWGFNGHKVFSRKIHGLRCEFESRGKDWVDDTVLVFDDGYSVDGALAGTVAATEYETMSFPGFTDVGQVVREARYRIAARRLRPEVYEMNSEWEFIACTRGDLVRVTHDVPQWGTGWGTVTSVVGAVVGLSHGVTMESAHSYAVRFRSQAGADVYRTVTLDVGEKVSITLASAPTGIVPGDLFQFGELAPGPSVDLLVLGIYPEDGLVARLLLVDYSPAIFTADTGSIPAFDPRMTKPPPLLIPVPPPPGTMPWTQNGGAPNPSPGTSVVPGAEPGGALEVPLVRGQRSWL